jgi:hypothetical protein
MNEYPTEAQLQAILDFEGSPAELVEYIDSIYWANGFTVKSGFDDYLGVKRCFLSTHGWSGNEDIIGVLRQTWFWMLWWRQSNRGGHYIFEVPTKQWWDKKYPMKFGLPHSKVEM